ncbi:inositol 2-dehydrogenase-like [Panonychus citri]|uniref:inositol 2-dehydrogenase-like n=1 Tax=Panonychus citri TaxID=50023 RepID=UPI0023082583|nr:inositol 2-dehydrogenase-like [Panonychus citri]
MFRYQRDATGWKVLRNGYVHDSDKIEKAVKLVGKDGLLHYDQSRVRVALFGLGRIGTVWIDRVLKNSRIQLVYCVESYVERANYFEYLYNLKDVKMIHPNCADEVFSDPDVDAVIISTPTGLHESLTLKSLSSGKAVMCERPLAERIETIEKVFRLAIQRNLPVLTVMNRRFDPAFRIVRHRVKKGEIGTIHGVEMCSRDSLRHSAYKGSTNIFLDLAIHDIDLICWIVGQYPNVVIATGTAFDPEIRDSGDYDTIVVVLKFTSGVLGTIDMSRSSVYGYDQRLEVFGSKGLLTGPSTRPTYVTLDSESRSTTVPYHHCHISRFTESYTNQLEHFVDCIKGLSAIEVKPMEVMAATKVAQACTESARIGKPIELTWKES